MTRAQLRVALWTVTAGLALGFLLLGGPAALRARIHNVQVDRIVEFFQPKLDDAVAKAASNPKRSETPFDTVVRLRDELREQPLHDARVDAVTRSADEALVRMHSGWIAALEELPPRDRLERLRPVWTAVDDAQLPPERRATALTAHQSAVFRAWQTLLDETLAASEAFQDASVLLPQAAADAGGEFAFAEWTRLRQAALQLWEAKVKAAQEGRPQLLMIRSARTDLDEPGWQSRREFLVQRALTEEAISSAAAAIDAGNFAEGLGRLEEGQKDTDLLSGELELALGRLSTDVRSRLVAQFNADRGMRSERDALPDLLQSLEPVSRWVDASAVVQESRDRIAGLLPRALREPTVVDSPVHNDLLRTLPVHERTQQLLDLALLGVLGQAQPAQRAAEFDLALAPILRQPVLREVTLSPYGRGRLARLTAPDDPSPEYVAVVPPAASPERALPGFDVDAKTLYDLVDDRLLDVRFNDDRGTLHIVRVELPDKGTSPVVQYQGAVAVADLFTPGHHGFKEATLTDMKTTRAFAESIDRVLSVSLVNRRGEYVVETPTVTGRDVGGVAAGRLSIDDLAVLYRAYSDGEQPGFSLDPCYDAGVFAQVLGQATASVGDALPQPLREQLATTQERAAEFELIPNNKDDPTGWYEFLSEGRWLNNWVFRINRASSIVDRQQALRERPVGFSDDFNSRIVVWAKGILPRDENVVETLRTELEARANLDDAFNRAAKALWRPSSLTPSQTFRYDAEDTAGTEVGWTLAYTDLMMKLWSIRASATDAPVPGLVSLLDLEVDPTLQPLLRELSAARMWLELDPVSVIRDDEAIRFSSVATRISARGNDGSPLPSETRPAPDYEESIRGWNSAYTELAQFEPQFARLDQIMRWSVVFSYVAAGESRANTRLPWLSGIEVSKVTDPVDWWAAHPELREQAEMPWITNKVVGTTHPILPLITSPVRFSLRTGNLNPFTGGVSLPSRPGVERRRADREMLDEAAGTNTARLVGRDRLRELSEDDFQQLLSRFSDRPFSPDLAEVLLLQASRNQLDPEALAERWREVFGPLERYILRSQRDGSIALWTKQGNVYSASSRLWLPNESAPAARAVVVQVGGAQRPLWLKESLHYENEAYPLPLGQDISEVSLSTLEVGAAEGGRIAIDYVPRDRVLSAALTDALASGRPLPTDVFSDIRVSDGGRRYEAAVRTEHGGGLIVATQGGGGGQKPPTDGVSAGGLADPDGWNGRYQPDGDPAGDPAPSQPQFARFRMTGKAGSTLVGNADGSLIVASDAVWSPTRGARRVDLWVESENVYQHLRGWIDDPTQSLFVRPSQAGILATILATEVPVAPRSFLDRRFRAAWADTRSRASGADGVLTAAASAEGYEASRRAAVELSDVQLPAEMRASVRIGRTEVDDPTVTVESGVIRLEGLPRSREMRERLNEVLRHRSLRRDAIDELPAITTTLSRAERTLDLLGARRVTVDVREGKLVLRERDGTETDLEAVWNRSADEATRVELSMELRSNPETLHRFFRRFVQLRAKFPDASPKLYLDLGLPGAEQRLIACANLTGVDFHVQYKDVEGVPGAQRALDIFTATTESLSRATIEGGRYRARIVHNRGPQTASELEVELLGQPATGDYLDLCICIDSFTPEEFQRIFELVPKLIRSGKYSAVTINPIFVPLPAMALIAKEAARRADEPIPNAHLVVSELTDSVIDRLERFTETRDESLLDADELDLLRELGGGEITDRAIDAAIEDVLIKRNGHSPPIVLRMRLGGADAKRAA